MLGRIKKLFGFGKEKTEDGCEERNVQKDQEPVQEEETLLEEYTARAALLGRLNRNEDMRQRYASFLETKKLREDWILYESFGGRGMTCSPYALFCHLLAQPKYASFIHIWVLDDFEDNRWQIEAYKKYKNVMFIKYQSLEYREYLASAKYLVNNVSFPGYFTKREGQIYINTWHGIPLKTIGFDIPSGNVSNGNSARNLLAADYLMAPNEFMKEIYERAFKMSGIFQGRILLEGQPRNDRYFHTTKREVFEKLAACGIKGDPQKKIILYAPTWKGSRYSSPDTSLDSCYELMERIEKNVDRDKYQVFVKPHQIVYYHMKKNQIPVDRFIPATVDTNELLSVVDVLISDYSSIYFDFLVSGKPILFFIPDLEEYLGYRGLYFGMDKLPGPIAKTYGELEEMVRDIPKAMEPFKKKYKEEAAWACPKDDGEVCQRVSEAVFGQEIGQMEQSGKNAGKKRLLLYGGRLKEDRQAFSLTGLLGLLDYERFDTTLVVEAAQEEREELLIQSLPSSVRVLYRGQPANGSPKELAAFEMYLEGKGEAEQIPESFLRREIRRMFGEAVFDFAVDLSRKRSVFLALMPAMKETKGVTFEGVFLDVDRIRREAKEKLCFLAGDSLFLADESRWEKDSLLEVEALALPDPEKKNYAVDGRLMEPDGLCTLLEHFTFLCEKDKDSRLYILGEGVRTKEAEEQIRVNALEGSVFFPGFLRKPFAFLSCCYGFVSGEGEKEEAARLCAAGLGLRLLREDFTLFEGDLPDMDSYNQKLYESFERSLYE